jgi:hypothetical protein
MICLYIFYSFSYFIHVKGTFKRYAFGMIAEYISEEVAQLLEKHLDLPPVANKTLASEELKEPPAKRQKTNGALQEPTEDYSKDHKYQPVKVGPLFFCLHISIQYVY